MIEREHINNKRSHFHLSYFHSRPISISLSNLVPIPMGILRERWESRIFHSHSHLYMVCMINRQRCQYLVRY